MPANLFELDVRLREIEPPIWRTIHLPGTTTLEDVHFAIQAAMGWQNSHLHQFAIGDRRFGMVDVDELPGLEDERAVRLEDVAKQGVRLTYQYDFGDGWQHDITVSRVTLVPRKQPVKCMDGARRCPPEDCGGPGGYAQLIAALADPRHAEHARMSEWAGDFEPEDFAVPSGGLDLRRKIEMLQDLAEIHELAAAGGDMTPPLALVEAAMRLDPERRAALAAMIIGSLVEEIARMNERLALLAPLRGLVDDETKRAKAGRPPRGRRGR